MKKNKDVKQIDEMVDELINNFIAKEDINLLDKPLSLNIQFEQEDSVEIEDIENLIVDNETITLTMYTPYNINKLRFFINPEGNRVVVRSFDFLLYKQFWLGLPVIKDSLDVSYSNNTLEIKFLLDKNKIKVKNL